MKYYLNFLSDNYGRKLIDEPIGVAEIDFNIKQEQGRMARDYTLNGDIIEFEFSYMRNHELKQLLYYFNKFGYEARVELEIVIDAINTYVCELDFAQAETDDLEYFKCKGILIAERQVIKRRKSVKVDLYSDTNVDGDYIGKLNPENVLILSTPLRQISNWEQPSDFTSELKGTVSSASSGEKTDYFFVNPVQSIIKSEIDETLTGIDIVESYKNVTTAPTTTDFSIIKAKTNLKNTKISLKNIDLSFYVDPQFGAEGNVTMEVKVCYGLTYETSIKTSILTVIKSIGENYSYVGDLDYTIPELSSGDSIWVFISFKVVRAGFSGSGLRWISIFTTIKGMSIEISTDSVSYNSVVPSVSLYDAMKQVIKSISGMDIVAPRFQSGGSLYGNRLMNGNSLRNILNKPFSISLEDIEKSLTEMKCDYEITPEGKVFFGSEVDFYTSNEIGFFPNTQFSEMSKTFNPLYSVNEFYYNFKKYQALKENTVAGTADTIHGESRFVFHNKKVENKKVVDVEWTRDILLIEELRKIGLKIEENTSTQDDDDIFILDCVSTTTDQSFTESFEVKHTYNPDDFKLSLRNDNSFNFVTLGIYEGSQFEILAPDNNSAVYIVFKSSPNELILTRTYVSLGVGSSAYDGVRVTKIKYTIDDAVIPYTNRRNEGFDTISNLNAGDKASNLRYSVGRNIRNFWWSYLSTVNLYWKNESIKNNWYKNNGECTTVYNGITVKEKSDIIPNNPIVTPMMYNKMIFSNVEFLDYVTLQNNLRTQRGFIRAIDNNEKVIKVYPTELMYSMLDKELVVKGEEKYEPITMTISTANNLITINSETITDSVITEIVGEKFYIYDLNRQLLYNGVYWSEVAINGALPISKAQLQEWMNLLN